MYKEHFGFTAEPSGLPRSPILLREPEQPRGVQPSLGGLTERRGLMTLIGAVGTGKTTVLRHLVARSQPAVWCILAEYPPSNFDELLTVASRARRAEVRPRGTAGPGQRAQAGAR